MTISTITYTKSRLCWLCTRCSWCKCSQEKTISPCNQGRGSVKMTCPIYRIFLQSSSVSSTSVSMLKIRHCKGRKTGMTSRFSGRSTVSSIFRTGARMKISLSLKPLKIWCNLRLTRHKKRSKSCQDLFQGNAQIQQQTLRTLIRKMLEWASPTKLTWSFRR